MLKSEKTSVAIGGQTITFETGKIGRQAGGSVLLTCGETVIYTAATASKEVSPTIDFLPLTVHYQEKFSAAGKTLGGYLKREGRPTEREILLSRLIDRPIRPLFEKGYFAETQVLTYVWSYDGIHPTDPLAICCASAALVLSDIPLIKPIGAVRVGMIEGLFVINPTTEQMYASKLDLILAGTEDAVLMIEGYCDFLTEEQVVEAIEKGHEAIQAICRTLKEWQQKVGKPKYRDNLRPAIPQETYDAVKALADRHLPQIFETREKLKREALQSEMTREVKRELLEVEEPQYTSLEVLGALKEIQSSYLRSMVVEQKLRCDGRGSEEIRPIAIEEGLLPRVHGSALFTRGETQALAVCTLGGESMSQRFEDLHGEGNRRFYLQYFFPPFSVGEVGRSGPPGRREIGHGKLAERALMYSLPSEEQFPYTIRLESNITESNGSSSMASVCGGCLALMNAGVPIERPVSGIAMGLVLEGERYTILSDILGVEDALGDMDFKITGDKEGITAFQMDIKVEGITPDIMRAALNQAKEGRIRILDKMLEVVPSYKEEMSRHAPRIEKIKIKPSQIGSVIGPGGSQIRAIVEETGATVDINDDGIVTIASPHMESVYRAKEIIEGITAEVEVGKVYEGKVKGIKEFGLFVEVLPGKEGLCHISEFDHRRVEKLDDLVKIGDQIRVKVLNINDHGQIRLSRKALIAR